MEKTNKKQEIKNSNDDNSNIDKNDNNKNGNNNNNNNNNNNINKKKSTSPGTIMLQHISIGTSVKIMISRLQTNGTNMSQRL